MSGAFSESTVEDLALVLPEAIAWGSTAKAGVCVARRLIARVQR
jgi:hypothetical protein